MGFCAPFENDKLNLGKVSVTVCFAHYQNKRILNVSSGHTGARYTVLQYESAILVLQSNFTRIGRLHVASMIQVASKRRILLVL